MIYFRVPRAIWKICSMFGMLAGLLAPAVSFARPGPETKESAAAVLETVLERHGVEEARSRFNEMRNEEDKFNFDAREFVELGRGYYRGNKIEEAVTILEMAVDLFPETRQGYFLLACAYWKMGEPALAMSSRQKMQSVQEKATLAEFIETYGDSLASTAEEVIEKHVAAIGGEEAVAGIRTMVVKFGVNSTNGNTVKMVRYYKRPGFYRQGVAGSDQFTATDGETVWNVSGAEWAVSEDRAYRRMGSIDGHFIDYADRGVTYGFVGAEIFNSAPVYHLKRTFEDGFEQDLFFSVETGYLTEIESEYPPSYPFMKSVMSLWDYRDVGGIMIPHVFIRNMGGLGPPHGGVVEEVQVNVPLDDSLFVKPR